MPKETDILLSLPEVVRRTGLSRPTIYRKIGDGSFPRQVKAGKHAVRWRESAITAWIESRPDADGDAAQ